MSDIELSRAPWDDLQKTALNLRQLDKSKHQYTCKCGATLIACHSGWACPKEGMLVVQDWAYQFDIDAYKEKALDGVGGAW
jgi:hypothetical protein